MLLTSLQKKDNAQERSLTVCMMYTINIADIFLPKTKHGDFMYKGYLDLLWIYCGMQRPNTMQDKNETGAQARTKVQAKKQWERRKKMMVIAN